MILLINTTNHIYSKSDFKGFDINVINTVNLTIKNCTGCFGCWVKTPGECFQKDDMPLICSGIMKSSHTIFITDVKVGFVSAELKRVNDKMIQLIHPFMDIIDKEVHHHKRYKKYPYMGLILIDSEDVTEEVIEIINGCYQRMAINFRSKLLFTIKDDISLGRLRNEINNY